MAEAKDAESRGDTALPSLVLLTCLPGDRKGQGAVAQLCGLQLKRSWPQPGQGLGLASEALPGPQALHADQAYGSHSNGTSPPLSKVVINI